MLVGSMQEPPGLAELARPGLFRSHVAGSPSIWWNDRAIFAVLERYLDAPQSGKRQGFWSRSAAQSSRSTSAAIRSERIGGYWKGSTTACLNSSMKERTRRFGVRAF